MNTRDIALALHQVDKSLESLQDPFTEMRLKHLLTEMFTELTSARVHYNHAKSCLRTPTGHTPSTHALTEVPHEIQMHARRVA